VLTPLARVYSFPTHRICHFPIDTSATGASQAYSREGGNGVSSSQHLPVTVILPSEWARMDVLTPALYHRLFPDSSVKRRAVHAFDSIEYSPIVLDRRSVTDANTGIYNTHGGIQKPLRKGDGVRISLRSDPSVICAAYTNLNGYSVRQTGSSTYDMDGRINAVWVVGAPAQSTESAAELMNNNSSSSSSIINFLSSSQLKPAPPPIPSKRSETGNPSTSGKGRGTSHCF